jgi:aminoglycoside 2'-N-acetyltransferase I
MQPLLVISSCTADLDDGCPCGFIQVCIAAHHEGSFKNLFTYIPSGGRHFIAYHGAELVSHAVVTTRWLQPEGLPLLRTAYVDAVATLPIYQGQGYGSAVMRQLAMKIDDYAIACLETDKPGFYVRLGWELWREPLVGRGEQGLVPTPEQTGIMILRLPYTPPLDLDLGLTIEWQLGRFW